MKKILILFVTIFALSCNKVKEQAQENILVSLMTTGQWQVSSFIKANNDSTAAFIGYTFKFNTNNTVDAIKNGQVENTGTWNGDIGTKTITAGFNNPSPALKLLNGTWTITDSSPLFVQAGNTINGDAQKLKLVKI